MQEKLHKLPPKLHINAVDIFPISVIIELEQMFHLHLNNRISAVDFPSNCSALFFFAVQISVVFRSFFFQPD